MKTFSSSRVNETNLRHHTTMQKLQNGMATACSWGLEVPHYIKNSKGACWLRVKVVAYVDSYPVFAYHDVKGVDVTQVVNMSIDLFNFRNQMKKSW